MTDPNEPLKVVSEITAFLNDSVIPYFLTGSFASSYYGDYRATRDVDIVCALRREHIDSLVNKLSDEFFVDDEALSNALKGGTSCNLIHKVSVFKVDLFTKVSEFEKSELKRAKNTLIPGIPHEIKIISPEGSILSKLRWYSKGGRQSLQQWNDVLSLLRQLENILDNEYLDSWANRMRIADLLKRARVESISD